jgi:hypothetical protein
MFEWDANNRRFDTRPTCPYPDCGEPVEPAHQERVFCWCRHCERPYESALLRPADAGPPVEWSRRPESAFCTFTGARLVGSSPLDWAEAGGDPGRSSCLDDPRGNAFGQPHPDHSFSLHDKDRQGWHTATVIPEEGLDDDAVSALAVLRGRVLAVTQRGRMAILDPETGALLDKRPLVWPSFPPPDLSWPVEHPPAARGKHILLCSPRQAQFRDLGPQLFPGTPAPAQPYTLVDPAQPGARFMGPPLGIDTPEPLFCLLEGIPGLRKLEDPLLRFFELGGRECGRCPAPGIARPPVYDRRSGTVLWLSAEGFVSALPQEQCLRMQGAVATELFSEDILDLDVSARPTAVLAPDLSGATELWVADVRPETGELSVFKASVDQALAAGELRWTRQRLGKRGDLVSLAVGRGPGHRANAAAQVMAVATDHGVFSFPKSSSDAMEYDAARGHEGADRRGSWDIPIITSAGVIARVPGAMHLLSRGMGWSDRASSRLALPVRYAGVQGMAIFGRRVFAGVGLGVRCFVLEPQEVS